MMILLCLIAFAVVVAAVLALQPRVKMSVVMPAEFNIYSLSARYRPMLRLLDGGDFDLLNDAGDPKLLRRMRSQRREIFRGYLRSLRRDHSLLCACVRELIVNAETDQRELVTRLFNLELAFNSYMFAIKAQLLLHSLGFGSVRVSSLIESFEQVRQQAELLAPSTSPSRS